MSALTKGAARIACRSRPTALRSSRFYASDAHGHHAAHAVEEPIGAAFYVAVSAIAGSIFVYSISRPGPDGEPSRITKIYDKFQWMREQEEIRNTLRTNALEQAAHDRHLLYNAPRNKTVDLKYPEIFMHGSPHNVPAGHYVPIDHVVEHYRQKHLAEEERKVKRLAAAGQTA